MESDLRWCLVHGVLVKVHSKRVERTAKRMVMKSMVGNECERRGPNNNFYDLFFIIIF